VDWDQLASELGVEPSSLPPAPPSRTQRQPRFEKPPVEKLSVEKPREKREAFAVEARLTETVEESSVIEESIEVGGSSEQAEEDRKSGRRRRRRRRKPRERTEAASELTVTEEEVVELRQELVEDVLETLEPESAQSGLELEEAEPVKKRSKRRRRRGGRSREKTGTSADVDASEDRSEKSTASEHHDDLDELASDDTDEGDEQSPRVGLRNIPTWDDAVGVIVAKNLESRAKHPGSDRPQGRGRGNHRGGRRRPSNKR